MNILVMGINYAPEPTGFAPHSTALCEHLARQGHTVTVITGFPFAPRWARWPEYRKHLMVRERVNDVEIWRVSHFVPCHPGRVLERLLMEGTFCLSAAWVELTGGHPRWDILLYIGAQPSIAMLVRLLAGLGRVPYVVKITDLAAQAAADVGIVRARWLQNLLMRFEYAAYRRASGAIVLCAGFQETLIAHHYPSGQIRIIHDSVDLEAIRPLPRADGFRTVHGLSSSDFVVLFSGSMGLKQGLSNVVEAARLLQAEAPEVKWVLVGDGETRSVVERQVAEYNLGEYVRVVPLQPESQMAAMFAAADVLLLNQVANVKDTVIPSKLLTYMASGRPVLAAVNAASQGAVMLREASGGLIVSPENPITLAKGVRQLQAEPGMLAKCGQRNRAYAERHFDRRKIVLAQEAFLAEIVGAWGPRPAIALQGRL